LYVISGHPVVLYLWAIDTRYAPGLDQWHYGCFIGHYLFCKACIVQKINYTLNIIKQQSMNFREAVLADIPQLSSVRLSVKENVLSNPALVTEKDYEEHLTTRGKGWVCEADGKIVGFAIGDLQKNNVWALFVQPGYEGKGIGRELLISLLDWYFENTDKPIWLSTAPNTRADKFYRHFGLTEAGKEPNGELRFELTAEAWG
jgi:GNAT superfamily N-acetyltransferase